MKNDRKKYLRSIGHGLKPVVTVAGKGLTESVIAEIDRALGDHELIKVKMAVTDREVKRQLIDDVQTIGHMLVLYRAAKKPDPKLSNLLRQ